MEPAAAAEQLDVSSVAAVQQRVSSSAGGLPGRLDPDVATLSLSIDQHMQALTKDAVDHLNAVKARLQANLQAAVDHENEDGNKRLAAKQAEADAVTAELKHTQQELGNTELVLDRVAGGYAAKQRAVYDRLNLLRSWYVWREWAHKERRLQYLGLRLQQWYVRRWLLGRAWDRWLGQAHLQYRTLVAERAEKQQKADAAALHAIHSQETGALRAQIEGLQQQLQKEAEARNKMEEEMKRSFMRGVTAINLEALQMMRRGAPPNSGANPFPVPLPLNSATAAAGLVAAGGQQQAGGAAGQVDVGSAAAGSAAAAAGSMGSTIQDWANAQQQQHQGADNMGSPAQGGFVGDSGAAAGGADEWGQVPGYAQVPDTSAQAQSVYGAAAVVQLQQPQQRLQQSALSAMPGLVARSSPQSGLAAAVPGASVPKVYVERGPGRSPAGAVAGSPQKAAAAGSPARSVGVRRSLQQGGRAAHSR